jgi:hypothetical protein
LLLKFSLDTLLDTLGSLLFSFLFGTAVGMNLLVSVAVKVIPEENKAEIIDVTAELVEVTETPTPTLEDIPIPEVLAAETQEQHPDNGEVVSESPTETPTETSSPLLTPTNTPTPSETITQIPTSTLTPTFTITPSPSATLTITPTVMVKPIASPTNLDELFARYSGQYGVDVNLLKKIAKCESNFNANAIGPKGLYLGMFQFGDGSWQQVRKQMGQDPNPSLRTSPEESIKTAAFAISLGRASMWPSCSK